jgi:hypothetical protein
VGFSEWKPEVYSAVIDGKITQFRAEATSLWKEERSTTEGIIPDDERHGK